MAAETNLIKMAEKQGDYKFANTLLNGLNRHLKAKVKHSKAKLKELKRNA